MNLGVNIDHIAVLREARRINSPDIYKAISILKKLKVYQVTIHLREDRRHINDFDAKTIIKKSSLPVNLECSINNEIIDIVLALKPKRATLVPENRDEVTTEGGLDVIKHFDKIKKVIESLNQNNIESSLFVEANKDTIKACKDLNAKYVEIHTGEFSNIYAMLYLKLAKSHHSIKNLELGKRELKERLNESLNKIKKSAKLANKLGLIVAAGHGLNYHNVSLINDIKYISELNIGQSIIARSVYTGFKKAVLDMINILK